MHYRTAQAHDIVAENLRESPGDCWEYWSALQTIIYSPEFDECDDDVKEAAYAAVHSNDLNPPDWLQGPW